MIFNEFFSTGLKCTVKQVNKKTAEKLFNKGIEIFLKPSNMLFDCMWSHPMPLKKDTHFTDKWDCILNEFIYYNCDSERGKYIQFFVRSKDMQ